MTHFIRAGFELRHEDQSDSSSRHPEFIATHKKSGQRIAVEAKSRRRAGVLGFAGERRKEEVAEVRNLLGDAIKKAEDISDPYVIFVDVNLPPETTADPNKVKWFQDLVRRFQRSQQHGAGPHPYCAIIFTNQPYHYGEAATPVPGTSWLSSISLNPRVPLRHARALEAVLRTIDLHSNIPNFFES